MTSVVSRRLRDAHVPGQRSPAAARPERTQQVQNLLDLASTVPGQRSEELAQRAREQAPLRCAVARVLGLASPERVHREAARREAHVAALLETLGNGWRSVHGVPLEGTDSMSLPVHLLVGRGGAYAVVATASHTEVHVDGDLFLDGTTKRADVLRARRRAYRAATALSAACGSSVAVSGLVLVATPRSVNVVHTPHRVEVIHETQLAAWIARRPTLLTSSQVDHLHTAARRSETWET